MPTEESFTLPVSLRIKGNLREIYGAWLDPDVANKWLCNRLEGAWSAGETVYWCFGEDQQEISVSRVEKEKLLEFRYRAYGTQPETTVRIEFEDLGTEVRLKLTESSFPLNLESVRWALDHACGWENIFCRLKAWKEGGISLL